MYIVGSVSTMVFQSTHPRGVRPAVAAASAVSETGFNPRTRVGCDIPEKWEYDTTGKFQSTHPRGVRRYS
ncbi:hypothetical protein Holit_03003 [Hollandina sp. SP2]